MHLRGARSFGIALFSILCACKKTEPVQQVAPTETGVIAVASSAPSASAIASASASAEPEPIASIAPLASASAAPNVSATSGLTGAGHAPEDGMFRNGRDRLPGRHQVVPAIRVGTITVTGKLPMEVVRRIVRQHLSMFRACYEDGLKRNPSVQGRITTKYVIGQDGDVVTAQDGGSDLPDANVVQCVVNRFKTFAYPKPEGGVVLVSFPLVFSPSDE